MKRMSLLIYALIVALSAVGKERITSVPYSTKAKVEQWHVIDILFDIRKKFEYPFNIQFGAWVTSPDGKEMKIPGFYNGEKQWVIRFSGNIVGDYQYITFCSIKQLSNLVGTVEVTKNTDESKNGPIIINKKNPQHFSYKDGTPYMPKSFGCDWLFALDHHTTDTMPKTTHLLDLVQKNGFNQIVTTIYSNDVDWEKDKKLKEHSEHEYGGKIDIFPFRGTNENPDFSALNINFFKHLDRTIYLMNERNIVAHLKIYAWNKNVNWPEAESVADDLYFDYVVRRYQAFSNVIWDISEEVLKNQGRSEAYAIQRIQQIRRGEAFKRLITVQDYEFCSRNTEQVDFISVQNWSSTLYSDMLNLRRKYSKIPVLNAGHGGYEVSPYDVFSGDYTDPQICLRRNYLCNFAGAYTTYYWQGAASNVIIHNPFEQGPGFVKPRFDYYKHLSDFFDKYPHINFEPEPESNHSGYCLKSPVGTYLIYVPKENHKLSVYRKNPMAKPGGTVQWFNTLTGEYTMEVAFDDAQFISPWRGVADAILIRKLKQ